MLIAPQVAASSTPVTGSFRSPWNADNAFWKFLPKAPSISPQEKCARPSRIWARATPAPLAPSARSPCTGLFTFTGSMATTAACSASAENAKLTQRDIIRLGWCTPSAAVGKHGPSFARIRQAGRPVLRQVAEIVKIVRHRTVLYGDHA